MSDITNKLIDHLDKIRDSLLAPWQKLDAKRSCIQPCLTYAFRSCPVTLASLKAYCSKLIDVLRSICNLPKRATNAYFFASKSAGGLGLQDPNDEKHVQSLVHAIKMLTSTDPLIMAISCGQLESIVHRCVDRDPTMEEIDEFLSGSSEGALANHSWSNNSGTLWSCARIAARKLQVSFVDASSAPSKVSVDESSSANAKSVAFYLHRHCQQSHAEVFKAKNYQGKVARAMQQDRFGTGSFLEKVSVSVTGGSSTVPAQIPSRRKLSIADGPPLIPPAADAVPYLKPFLTSSVTAHRTWYPSVPDMTALLPDYLMQFTVVISCLS